MNLPTMGNTGLEGEVRREFAAGNVHAAILNLNDYVFNI